jgi:hypothetical protein
VAAFSAAGAAPAIKKIAKSVTAILDVLTMLVFPFLNSIGRENHRLNFILKANLAIETAAISTIK